MNDRLLTPAEAAKMLSTTPKALDHRRRSGEIRYVMLGRLVRYRLATIQDYIESNETRMAPRKPGRPRVVAITREVSR